MARKRRQIARVPDPYWDKELQITRIPPIPDDEPGECPHPGPSKFAWLARDDHSPGNPKTACPPGYVWCVACCACGAVLQGGATLPGGSSE